MGRIKKVATDRHTATLSPIIADFVTAAASLPLHQLPAKLAQFPQHWPFPRGDLYHWIPLLDRFDHVLELFNKAYALSEGPQTQPFGRGLLLKGDTEHVASEPATDPRLEELEAAGYSEEGDRQLVESIVNFTRILHEHCGNRSLYSSSGHINILLNTTSLSLLRLCLKLGLRLAQRFQVARYKNHHPQAQAVLKDNHYAFNYDNLAIIARPFPKPAVLTSNPAVVISGKGKEKAVQVQAQAHAFNPSDLVMFAKEPQTLAARPDLSSVSMRYYDEPSAGSRPSTAQEPGEASPGTPTPARRTSTLGPSRDRPAAGDRSTVAPEVNATPSKYRELAASSSKVLSITSSKVMGTVAWELTREHVSDVPEISRYDLLNRIRIAKGLAEPETTHQELLEVRLLAISNLAYALGDTKFQEKVGQADSEEPQRFQLAKQLADLLQPTTSDQTALSLSAESTVLQTLEALSRPKNKSPAIFDNLQITVNHGVLYYELRKVTASLNTEEDLSTHIELQRTEWREAAFDLVNTLMLTGSHHRSAEKMVQAGVMEIFVETLTFRTAVAGRYHEKILQFLSAFVHNLQHAFQTLASIKGLDIIAELTQSEVDSALRDSTSGNGLADVYKSKVVDYDISFHRQSTLRQLFKFTSHLFEHHAGTHDRLLRNLIDTPQMLGALRIVIEHAHIFGSNVWSSALGIMSSFIHNEPTSYQVIGEAGLSKSLLESITGTKIPDELDGDLSLTASDLPGNVPVKDGNIMFPSVNGILPVAETMVDVPTAFGAICLNESGMQLFQASKALVKFFDIFVSPVHVCAMEDEGNGSNASTIGSAFDELSRHHPQLKAQIMMVVKAMVDRVATLCRDIAVHKAVGTKLWRKTLVSPAGDTTENSLAAAPDPTLTAPEEDREHETSLELEMSTSPLSKKRKLDAALPFVSVCIKFLDGFFHNGSMCALFCEMGGAESLLDLVTSPSNPYDMDTFALHSKIGVVLKTMCDAKVHLVLPSLLRRLQNSFRGLGPLVSNKDSRGFFASFYDVSVGPGPSTLRQDIDSTAILRDLGVTQLLSGYLARILLAAPPHHPRTHHNQQSNPFLVSLNFTDVYLELIEDLGNVHAACVWEYSTLLASLSLSLNDKTDPRQLSEFVQHHVSTEGLVELLATPSTSENITSNVATTADVGDEKTVVKNVKAIRHLLYQTPASIELFFQSLSQSLTPKRSTDNDIKLHANLVAEKLADKMLWELDYRKFDFCAESAQSRYSWLMINQITHAQLRSTMEPYQYSKEALTLVLSKFHLKKGFQKLNEYLRKFGTMLRDNKAQDDLTDFREPTAQNGVRVILEFYSHVVRSKCITEAMQSNVISVRDHRQADYFMPGQFVVEIRNAIMPAITEIWESEAMESMKEQQVTQIIEILRIILKGEGEERAIKRSDDASRRVSTVKPSFALKSTIGLQALQNDNIATSLAREAVYRCRHHESHSREYANMRVAPQSGPRFPVPEDEQPEQHMSTSPEAPTDDSTAANSTLHRQQSVEMRDPVAHDPTSAPLQPGPASDATVMQVPEDNAVSEDGANTRMTLPLADGLAERDVIDMFGRNALEDILNITNRGGASAAPLAKMTGEAFVTVDDLDDKRAELREDLVDRCLGVLSAVPAVTFELSDLIQAAVAKSGEGANPRAEIGKTIVSSLMSLQGDDLGEKAGIKIYAYAHLVALILQDRDFFDSTLDDLKEYFENLVAWVEIPSDAKAADVPYLEMILLIIERVLAEDEQPIEMEWEAPSPEDPLKPQPTPMPREPVVSHDLRLRLFDALMEILPKVGKNTSLGLSVARTLVMLTRERKFATRLSQKTCMSRLFLMIRQMAGFVNEKLHGAFMIVLRHMIEDRQTIRQIMKTEIKAAFESHRSARAMDTTTYTRNFYHLVLRDPELFVDVTQEMLEIVRFDGIPTRAQSLGLKRELPMLASTDQMSNGSSKEPSTGATPAIEQQTSDAQEVVGPDAASDGTADSVIAFLLRELSNYKDVEDSPAFQSKEDLASANVEANHSTSNDVDMTDTAANGTGDTSLTTTTVKNDKPTFRADEHAIYIYRCFILQCLAELLASYTRTKVEFINFSRKPETQPATPSKPRAGTLNYILNTLVPVGTLEHKDDIAHKKKLSTSSWAITVLVSLVAKTKECIGSMNTPEALDSPEDEQLAHVRKFVLEHVLRSFKEATGSVEPLDQRYSRLLGLGEVFNRMLTTKAERDVNGQRVAPDPKNPIGKLMYEKNFISALTSAIAELDLNFPNAKRAVKYMLGPLRVLTDLGVTLSQSAELTSSDPGTTTDEVEISSATSVSDDEQEEREHTPDLLRNTTLGMYESGTAHDEDSESEDEDDDDADMYDDGLGYDDDMDYEEEGMAEHGDVVSDEDEEIAGMGTVEGVPGDVDMNLEVIVDRGEVASEDDSDDLDQDDDDEDDDEDDDNDDGMDEDGFENEMDGTEDITGDDENGSMVDPNDEGDWEEDPGAGFEAGDIIHDGGSPHGGPLDHIARVIGAGDGSDPDDADGVMHMADMGDGDEEVYFVEDMAQDDDGMFPPQCRSSSIEELLYAQILTHGRYLEEENPDLADVVYEPELEGLLHELSPLHG